LAAEKTLSNSAMVILKAMSFRFIGFSLLVHDAGGCGVQLGTPPPAVSQERSGGWCVGLEMHRSSIIGRAMLDAPARTLQVAFGYGRSPFCRRRRRHLAAYDS
jgi:hypothetical protein